MDKNTEKLSYDNSYSPDNVIDLLVSYDEEFFKADDVKIRDIQLKDDNHKNLHGYVDIYVDGKYYKRLNINHDKETLNLGKLKVGKHTIKVQVKEGYYVECKISVVNPLSKTSTSKTTVKAPTVTAYYKASKYFKVTVKKNGKPVKNLKLKVKVYTGSKYKTYTIKTNKNGVAKLSTKKFKVGSHKVKITSTNKKYKISKTSKIIIKKKVSYTTFKSPSGYTWKIKTTTWNKMKKEAVNNYKFFRSVGSYHPGYSDSSVTVKLTKNGHTYTGTAYAVQNSNYMRCEIRGAVNGVYISDKGNTYV